MFNLEYVRKKWKSLKTRYFTKLSRYFVFNWSSKDSLKLLWAIVAWVIDVATGPLVIILSWQLWSFGRFQCHDFFKSWSIILLYCTYWNFKTDTSSSLSGQTIHCKNTAVGNLLLFIECVNYNLVAWRINEYTSDRLNINTTNLSEFPVFAHLKYNVQYCYFKQQCQS